MNKEKISCSTCKKQLTCNSDMDYPICLSSGECKYIGEKEDEFHYSLFEPKFEMIQLFPKEKNND